jgi:predicted ATPase
LEPYRAVGVAMRGEVATLRGELAAGITDLRSALAILEGERHRVLSTSFLRALAEALSKNKQDAEASVVLDRAFAQAEANGEGYLMSDLHRARGEILAFGADPVPEAAERHFRQAIDAARVQSSRGWHLRVVLSLARLLLEQGRKRDAASLLESTIGEFDEGFDQPIMRSALTLLGQIDGAL